MIKVLKYIRFYLKMIASFTQPLVYYCFGSNCLPSKKLLPTDAARKKEALELYNLFYGEFEEVVNMYVHAQML